MRARRRLGGRFFRAVVFGSALFVVTDVARAAVTWTEQSRRVEYYRHSVPRSGSGATDVTETLGRIAAPDFGPFNVYTPDATNVLSHQESQLDQASNAIVVSSYTSGATLAGTIAYDHTDTWGYSKTAFTFNTTEPVQYTYLGTRPFIGVASLGDMLRLIGPASTINLPTGVGMDHGGYQTGTLGPGSWTLIGVTQSWGGGYGFNFSLQPVPEPAATTALILLGITALRRRRELNH